MQTKTCPQCEAANFASNRTCKNCLYTFSEASIHHSLPPVSQDAPMTEPSAAPTAYPYNYAPPIAVQTPNKASAGDVINGILWLMLCGYIALIFLDYTASSRLDTTAPQQGARAAMSCFYVIVGYCGVRAFTEAIRSGRGK